MCIHKIFWQSACKLYIYTYTYTYILYFSFCSPNFTINFSQLYRCCQRLAQVAHDRTLWRRVDFRSKPMLWDDLKSYMKFLQPMTTSLAMRGDLFSGKDSALTQHFFSNIRVLCNHLKELNIEEYHINGDRVLCHTL